MDKENTLRRFVKEVQNLIHLEFIADFEGDYIAYEKSNNDLSFEYYQKGKEFENCILNLFLQGEDISIGRIRCILEKIKSEIQYFLEIGFVFQLDEKKENTIVFEPEKTKSVLGIRLNYVLKLLAYMDNLHLRKQLSDAKTAYFIRSFTSDEQNKLFDSLINAGFLPKETICSHFCHVFGGMAIPDNESPFNPLKWEKSQSLLAYFVFNLFSETDGNFWNITAECFTVRGKKPNIGVMTTEQSKVKNKEKDPPKGHEKIDDIIMSLA
jgi:hypothetical protein